MSERDPRLYLSDILDSGAAILEFDNPNNLQAPNDARITALAHLPIHPTNQIN